MLLHLAGRLSGLASESRSSPKTSRECRRACSRSMCTPARLLLHDSGRPSDAMTLQGGIDTVSWPQEQCARDALRAGRHGGSVLTAQLLDQLSKLGTQVGACSM